MKPGEGWFHRGDVVFAAALAVICGLAVWVGIAPLRLFEHDTFFLLDNGYRVAQGQVPHRDFSSAWGPAIYLIEAVGLFLSGMRPAGIGYANALFGALIGIWAYCVPRARWSSASACLLGIYTLLLITAPFALGYGAWNFSHGMTYNRYGFAILGIILVECTAHVFDKSGGKRQAMAGALSTGAAFGILASLKISYAIMAVPFIVAAIAFGASRRNRLMAMGAGAGVVAALVLCYLRFDLTDMFRDLLMAASGRSRGWKSEGIPIPGFGEFAAGLLLLLLAVLAGKDLKGRMRGGLIALLTLGVGGVLIITNHQPSGWPLNGFAAIVLADVAVSRLKAGTKSAGPKAARGPGTLVLASMALAALSIAPMSFLNGISLAGAVLEQRHPTAPSEVRLASVRGSGMVFGPVAQVMTTETGGAEYVAALNDGLNLLRRQTGSRDGVLAMDMMNPFNYLLDRPSPRGGMAASAYNYVFSDVRHLTGDEFFGSAQFVMERKYSRTAGDYPIENYHIAGLLRIYEPMLLERFRLIEETPYWRLYGRHVQPGS